MSIKRIMLPILSLTAAITLGTYLGSHNFKPGSSSNTPMVKTYQVSTGRSSEAKGVLYRLFRNIDHTNVATAGRDSIIATFPKYYEKGVDQLMEQFKSARSENESKIRMDYWVLRGTQANIKKDINLKKLNPVIQSISEVDGKQNFQLLEHLSTNSISGYESKVEGWLSDIRARAYKSDQDVTIDIEFKTRFGKIESNTKVKNGDFVVIGQSAVNPQKYRAVVRNSHQMVENKSSDISKVYYVIKTSLL